MATTDRDLLNRVRYSGLDFNSALDEVLSRMQVEFATLYNDFAVASVGMMLTDLFAFLIDTMAFYLDRRASDLYLATARTRKSVSRTTRQLGYKMSPATAASVDLTLTPPQAYAFALPFPVGFQYRAPDGAIWESAASYTWAANDTTPRVITFSQTTTYQVIFTSTGERNQVFSISGIPDGEYLVGPGTDGISQVIGEVNGQTWTESELLQFGQTNQFEIGYNDDPPTWRFGDGVAGNIPPAGAQLRLTYRTSRGAAGQVTAGQEMTPVVPLNVNFQNIPLTVTVTEGSSGGSPPESISKAKANAPTYFKSRGVNVTKEDYQVRAGSFANSVYGAVAVASVVNVKSAATDAQLQNLVDDISNVSDEYVSTVETSSAPVSTAATAAKTSISAASDAIAAIVSLLTSIQSTATSAETTNTSVVTESGIANTFISNISAGVGSLSSTISAIGTGGSDQLQSSTKSTLLDLVATITAAATTASSKASNAAADASTVATSIETIRKSAVTGLTDVSSATTSAAAAGTSIDSAITSLTALKNNVALINNNVADIGQQIIDHVGSFLASDCQSNLIEVPVLAFDSDGFYVAPTIALIKSLQLYLDSKREVTQVVKVVSGERLLVPAQISVHIGVIQGYRESTVRSQVEAAILGRLRKRAFGSSLDISELYWVISPERGVISGLDFANVTIDGPAGKIDAKGNLIVQENEVVTRGTLAVTSEVVLPT